MLDLLKRFSKKVGTFFEKVKRTLMWECLVAFFLWLKTHQRLSYGIASVLTGISSYFVNEANSELRQEVSDLKVQRAILQRTVMHTNSDMDNLSIPWAEVTLRNGVWKLTGTNKAYDSIFNRKEIDVLGIGTKLLFDLDIAIKYTENNNYAVKFGKYMGPEPDPDLRRNRELFVRKKSVFEDGDTIVRMVIFFMDNVRKAIDDMDDLEIIEIVSDTVPNAVQDTIVKNSN